MEESQLENIAKEEKNPSAKKIAVVDALGNITYSLIVGAGLDYAAGLNLKGIAISRGYATAVNSVTGGPYGWWREKIFRWTKTKEESSNIRKKLADLLAFNTFQVPQYGTALIVGSLFSEGEINWNKVLRDGLFIPYLSCNWYNNGMVYGQV